MLAIWIISYWGGLEVAELRKWDGVAPLSASLIIPKHTNKSPKQEKKPSSLWMQGYFCISNSKLQEMVRHCLAISCLHYQQEKGCQAIYSSWPLLYTYSKGQPEYRQHQCQQCLQVPLLCSLKPSKGKVPETDSIFHQLNTFHPYTEQLSWSFFQCSPAHNLCPSPPLHKGRWV